MMSETARVMGKRRFMIPVPLVTPGLSRLWVSLVTQSPKALVAPLIQSLRHPMVAEDRWLQEKLRIPGKPFAEALADSLRAERLGQRPTARSVQRLPLPAGRDALWLTGEFAAWLPLGMRGLVRVARSETGLSFFAVGLPWPLLELTFRPDRSGPDRALLEVSGGLLAGKADGFPRLEFRTIPDHSGALAAVHDFGPRLPWRIYTRTQAYGHLWVMWRFGRHLARIIKGEPAASMDSA
jgi:hypothetical protein